MSWLKDDFSGPCDGTDDNFLMSDAQKSALARWTDKLELWYVLGLLIFKQNRSLDPQAKGLQVSNPPLKSVCSINQAQKNKFMFAPFAAEIFRTK